MPPPANLPTQNQLQPLPNPHPRATRPRGTIVAGNPSWVQQNSAGLQSNDLLLTIVTLLLQLGVRLANVEQAQQLIPAQIASQIQQSQHTAPLGEAVSQSQPQAGVGINGGGQNGRGEGEGGGGGRGEEAPLDDSDKNDSSKTTLSRRRSKGEGTHRHHSSRRDRHAETAITAAAETATGMGYFAMPT